MFDLSNLSSLWITLSSFSPSDARSQCRKLSELILILLPEAVSSREEVPASLLIHLPHVWLLTDRRQDDTWQLKRNHFGCNWRQTGLLCCVLRHWVMTIIQNTTDLSGVFCFIFIDEIHQEEPKWQKGIRVNKVNHIITGNLVDEIKNLRQ